MAAVVLAALSGRATLVVAALMASAGFKLRRYSPCHHCGPSLVTRCSPSLCDAFDASVSCVPREGAARFWANFWVGDVAFSGRCRPLHSHCRNHQCIVLRTRPLCTRRNRNLDRNRRAGGPAPFFFLSDCSGRHRHMLRSASEALQCLFGHRGGEWRGSPAPSMRRRRSWLRKRIGNPCMATGLPGKCE